MEHPSWAGMDHLEYLKRSFSIFENEEDRKILEKSLVCSACGYNVTTIREKTEVFGRHDHSFGNLGFLTQLGCFRDAPGCIGVQGVSHGYSWFRGYAWQIQVCKHCYTQLGWRYMSDEKSFYGLIFNTLREKEHEGNQ